MTITIIGTITEIGQTEQVTDKFSKREFTLDVKNGNYTDKVRLQFVKDRTDLIDPYKVGDEVRVHFNPSSREFNGKWYTNLTAWGIAREGSQQAAPAQATGGADNEPLPF